ncbi:M20 family metallopeptidase [Alphaproteobacteria bacterium]|jgi:amidohydrolase|nr:M20 family metallopeptidase [Alphaproteobacteria bacterium]MDB9871815.1 M20 family metallopeptidase [Alphaproteobacteria bacterium]|tara:strand:- start:711 stop:1883 length:1173 start_codon:yes stop_codon:yes gene_type:complete
MNINKQIQVLIPEMREWRHHIHQNPEIAYEENNTSDFIAKKLNEFGIEVHRGFGGTGIVGVIHGQHKGTSNKSIGIRADMDALPMSEKTNLIYSSKNEGKMHACGHDGHSTMLLGAAKYLAQTRNFCGTVYCIFQPAEEGGNAGAKAMINDGLFTKFHIDSVWGIHNWPGVPVGQAVIHKGFAMAGGDIIILTIEGKGGHAAQPQFSNDPIVSAGLTITALQTAISRQLNPFDQAVLSLTKINGGSAFNVIPDNVSIGGTLRSTNKKTRDEMLTKIKKIASNACDINNCKVNLEIRPGYPSTINDIKSAEFASKVFEDTFGIGSLDKIEKPTMTSEDFSYMLQEKPGAYIWLGAGENSEKLHSVYYDFNDELLPIGATYWSNLAETILTK